VNSAALVKIQAATAAEVCANFDLKKEAKELLLEGIAPREFVAALIEKKKYIDAIDFLAHALPAREGIWWGCLCMQHACGSELSPPDRAAATAAVQWVMHPGEENRAAAKTPAEAAGPSSPAGALAMAANQTGGSIAPPNAPVLPPSPFAPAKAVSTAVKLASIKSDPIKIAATQRSFVELGIGVAEGRFL
jgi:hypothetical protein